jgi:hypothetical protein
VIIEALLFLVLSLITGLLTVLGPFTPEGLIGSVSGGALVGFAYLNTFLPVTETLAGIGFLLGTYVWLFTYRVLREMWALVPIIGGH